MNDRASEVTIRHIYKSHRHGITNIQVEVVFSFSYMGTRRDGSPQRRWDSREYCPPTPESLKRLLHYVEKANVVEQYVSGDDWQFVHEITYDRK